MKQFSIRFSGGIALICLPILLFSQNFQRQYGNSFDNFYTKLFQHGANYYALGNSQSAAGSQYWPTISRLDANGVLLWTRKLDIAGTWFDAVVTPVGDLLVVGSTPQGAAAKSLIGSINPSGTFNWVRQYDVTPGDEVLNAIRLSPSPDNSAFPYYILGKQIPPGSSLDQVILMTMDASGNFGWKKFWQGVFGSADGEFNKDLEILANGDLVVCGLFGTQSVVFKADKTGQIYTGASLSGQPLDWTNVATGTNSSIYAAGGPLAGDFYLTKFDVDMLPLWEISMQGLVEVRNVWHDALSNDVFVTAGGTFDGLYRIVVCRFEDNGSSANLLWMKYLDNGETAYTGGWSTLLTGDKIGFVDGRIPASGGFGQICAFASVSGISMEPSCMTEESTIGWDVASLLYDAPLPPEVLIYDVPQFMAVANSAMTWSQADACAVQCVAEFTFAPIGQCGNFQFTNTSTPTTGLTYLWNFGDPNSGASNTSTAQNPTHQFSGCGTFNVCLTISGPACPTMMICQSVVFSETVPPTLSGCPPAGAVLTVGTNAAQCFYSGFQSGLLATDNCDPNPVITCVTADASGNKIDVTPQTQFAKGSHTITCQAVDKCGNKSQPCVIQLMVVDNQPPTIICPPSQTVFGFIDTSGNCKAVVNNLAPTVTDNCPMWSVSHSINGGPQITGDASGTMFMQGVSTVFYTVTDMGGNKATCSFTITVECAPQGELNGACGVAVATCFSGFINPYIPSLGVNNSNPVIALFDVRDPFPTVGLGDEWAAPKQMFAEGDATHCGQVFGLAIDKNNAILTTASTIYGDATNTPGMAWGPGLAGAIYRFKYISGAWVRDLFCVLPNSGSGLGNITYDKLHDQFFVTNHQDGLIYRIPNAAGPSTFIDTYLHTGAATFPALKPNFVPLGQRLWGIGYNEKEQRLYFARWNEDNGSRQSSTDFNEIESIGILAGGGFEPSTLERDEITLPIYASVYSNPVSDIEFSENGEMLLAEKVMFGDVGYAANPSPGGWAHRARILRYQGGTLGWTAPQVIAIGNGEAVPNSHNNSAGGVDFGYTDFDNASGNLLGCDERVWGTGDALMYSGDNNWGGLPLTSANKTVYGLAGMPVSGNTQSAGPLWVESTSIYVDLDGNLGLEEKLEIGDVDIFNCACPGGHPDFPCDSVMVIIKPVPMPGMNKCCYSVDLTNLLTTPSFDKICANLNTSGWVFNTGALLASGWQFDGAPSGTQICFKPLSGPIPTTPHPNLQNVLTFCLAETVANPPTTQQIVFEWFSGGEVVCEDTLLTECIAPVKKDTCFTITNLKAECTQNDYEYCLTFTVTNLENQPAYGFLLNALPAGFAWGPCVGCGSGNGSGSAYGYGQWLFTGGPLIPALSSQTFCVKIVASSPVLNLTNVCFKATIEYGPNCCTPPQDWCVTLKPCCDPCEQTSITTHPILGTDDKCCYSIDLDYGCDFPYYSHIDFNILTSDVFFGSHSTGWQVCGATPTQVCIKPFLGNVPSGSFPNLFSFCLTDIDMASEIPQQVAVTFWVTGSNGQDSIACDTILEFNCELQSDTCLFITDEKIECIPDSMKYMITVTVHNVSNPFFTAYMLSILNIGTGTITPNPIPFSPPLTSGNSQTVSFCYTPTVFPDADGKLILIYRLKNLLGDTCCNGNENFIDTLLLPPCDSCFCLALGGLSFYNFLPPLQDIHVECNDQPTVNLPCIGSDAYYSFQGTLTCSEDTCPSKVDWQFMDANGQTVFGGSVATAPGGSYFSFQFLYNQFPASGNYTLMLTGICGDDTCKCNIPIFIPPCGGGGCECGQFSNVQIHSGAATYNATCGSNLGYIGCPPNGFFAVQGQFNCSGPNCPPTTIDWELKDPQTGTTVMTGITANPNFSFNLPVSNFPLNGIYTLTLTGLCNGLPCPPCVITFGYDCAPPVPDTCFCASPTATLTSGTTTLNFGCGQGQMSQTVPCPVAPVTITSTIGCVGASGAPCPTAPNINWILSNSLGATLLNGSMAPPFNQTFSTGLVGAAGGYNLILTTLCPGQTDSCRCVIRWIQEDCTDTCECGSFENLSFDTGFELYPASCNGPNLILPCPIAPAAGWTFTGDYNCIGANCPPPLVNWLVLDANGVPVAGLSGGPLAGPGFSISLPLSAFPSTVGMYTLVLNPVCNGMMCPPCSIKFTIDCPPVNPCECGTFENLSFDTGFELFPASCNGPNLILPCPIAPAAGWTFTGDYNCIGANCPPPLVNWLVLDANGVPVAGLSGGPLTGPGFSISLPLSAFPSTVGMYTLVLNPVCNGMMCPPCSIKFTIDCPQNPMCVCGTFSGLSFNNNSGVVTSVNCNAPAPFPFIGCPTVPSTAWTFNGNFNCIGNNCTPTIQWQVLNSANVLVDPFATGTLTGPAFSFNIPLAWFPTGVGTYTLELTSFCNGVACGTCLIKFTIDCPPVNLCECGPLDWAEFNVAWSWQKPIQCFPLPHNKYIDVPCLKKGENYFIHGNYRCQPNSCGTDPVNWMLTGPGITGSITDISTTPYPHFDITMLAANFGTPGIYTLEISRMCGSKLCKCAFKFKVPPCPCSCDMLMMDVQQGFLTTNIPSPTNCKRAFRPLGLCETDQVTWVINGNVVGSTTGNGMFMHTFPANGNYMICMRVIRIDPITGEPCEFQFCHQIKAKCGAGINDFCQQNEILNGDFMLNAISGELGNGGSIADWSLFPNAGNGSVLVIDSSGSSDAGQVILTGGKGNFAGIYQEVNLPVTTADSFTILEFAYVNYFKDITKGTRLEFRLHEAPNPNSPFDVLKTVPIPDGLTGWQNRLETVNSVPNQAYKYLVICVQNDSDTSKSVVGIDNLAICVSETSSSNTPETESVFRLFPNPTTGELTIEWPGLNLQNGSVEFISAIGQTIRTMPVADGETRIQAQVADLPQGIYFLKIRSAGRQLTALKFVKQ